LTNCGESDGFFSGPGIHLLLFFCET